jgi:aminoglycoside phosphotransferase (APT) family kinase protein
MALHDHLTSDTLDRLRGHGVLADRDVTKVEALHQRSLCFRVHFADGGSAFVKRATRTVHDRWTAPVAAEGNILRELARLGVSAPAEFLIVDEPHEQLIVTEDLVGRLPLDRRRAASGGTHPAWAAAFGNALARLHGVPAPEPPSSEGVLKPVDFVTSLVQSWTVLTPRSVTLFPAGYAERAKRIRAAGLEPLLAAIASGWRVSTLIHGDVKSDNTMCAARVTDVDPVRLVDWEMAGWGDPRWDVGCLIGDYLFGWLSSMSLTADGNLKTWLTSANPPMAGVRAELQAATNAYQNTHAVSDADRHRWLGYAAVFLLQRLSSAAIHASVLPAHALAYLQVAAQLLRHPDRALEMLL